MNILTVDFETYYDKQFSLSKMTTEEYIRDPQFEVIGVSVQVDAGEPEWFSGTMEETGAWLRKFDWVSSAAVAHNAMFDLAILNWHFDLRPKRIMDTLSMARAIHGTEVGGSLAALVEHYGLGVKGTEVLNALGKRRLEFTPEELEAYGEYCKNDVVLTYKLAQVLMAEGFSTDELRLVDLTMRMFTEPVLQIDAPLLQAHLIDVKRKKERLLSKALVHKDDLMSNPKFAQLLIMLNVDPPMKVSPTTGKETYAFSKQDEEFRALEEHENPLVQTLVSARLGTKSTLEETRTERLIGIAERGALPVPLKYYAAHTGRWGGMDSLNLQNLPRGSVLKNAIMAPPGYVLVDCDSSQIEARTLAWVAGQQDLVDAFDAGEDVYRIMASAIYGKHIEEVTKGERFVGKTTILGSGFGMGPPKFHAQLKGFGVELPIEECERTIEVYRTTYPAIPALWRQAQEALEAMMQDQTAPLGIKGVLSVEGKRGIRLPNGLYIKYPNLRYVRSESGKREMVYDTKKGRTVVPTRIYGGKCVENFIQALARIAVGEQLIRVAKKYKVVMTVHDAVCALVPEREKERGLEYVALCMRIRPAWAPELPLNCEAGADSRYGQC
jgi:DNA polymerase I-like protein with 3'-5' exonuclease and polymerase domains